MRRSILPLFALMLIAGCGRNDPGENEQQSGSPNTVVKPKSGGELVLIKAGTFTMGDAKGQEDEKPHTVSVSSFFMDRYPVTQDLYEKVMGKNPSKHKEPNNPVERTQWIDAVRFCNKCSEQEGLKECYYKDGDTWKCSFTANGYRLPTEAEWEFACRAGSTAKFCCGDEEKKLVEYAWFKPLSENKAHPVGLKKANVWGLFDMHGNVWQWCNDWYGENYYPSSPKENPTGPTEGTERVLRGGAYDKAAEKCRAAYRFQHLPSFGDACVGADAFGFRRVRADVQDDPNFKLRPK